MESFKISIVLPTLNERDNLAVILPKLLALGDVEEVILADDGSTDGTAQFLASFSGKSRVVFLQSSTRLGVAGSILQGVRVAKASHILVRDSDLNHQFSSVQDLIEQARAGADFVIASRYLGGGAEVARFNDVFSLALNRLLRVFFGRITDWTFGFFLVRKSALKDLPAGWAFRGRGEYTIRLYRLLLSRGVAPKEVFTTVAPRGAGVSTTRTFRHGPSYLRCLLDRPPPNEEC